MHCKIRSSIPGLYVVETVALLPTPNYDNQKSLQTLLNGLWGQNCFLSITSSLAVSSHLCNSTTSSMEMAPKPGFSLEVSNLTIPFDVYLHVDTFLLLKPSSTKLNPLPPPHDCHCYHFGHSHIRHYSKHFTCVTSINHHNDTMR